MKGLNNSAYRSVNKIECTIYLPIIVYPESEVPYFLAQELVLGYLNGIEGTYAPPRGYFVAEEDPEGFAAFDAMFPEKEKAFQEGQLPQFCRRCGKPLRSNADCGIGPDGKLCFTLCRDCL